MIGRVWVCPSDALQERAYVKLDVLYSGEPASLILFRFQELCFSYVNRCVHMGRALDGEEAEIFDPTGTYLRCSMHGILFDPVTGESLSPLCRGERLATVRVLEEDGAIWIKDRRVSARPV
jgi:nitrite reductase/ring-hydroxylating ferredoxin subunit